MADFSELNITAALQIDKDAPFDKALRPNGFKEFIGQKTVANQLRLLLDSAKKRQVTPDHLLFSGPPGLGKTSLAMLVAKELNVNLKITSGPSITRSGDLASILSALEENDILFIDEIHRLPAAAAEMLYIAMEDFRVDVVVGKGVGANSIALPISPFTCIGATTRSGLLPAPLRDRFGFIAQMNYYSPEELAEIVKQSAKKLKFEIDNESALEIGKRSRQTARIANRLLARVRDFAEVNNNGQFNLRITKQALELFEIDESGLDSVDRKVLKVLVENNAKAVGLKAIAAQVSEEVDTIEGAVEPYLLRAGFIKRTATGRIATEKSYKLFDKPYFGELLNNDNLFKLGESVCLINPENQKKTLKLEAKTVNTRDGELNLEEIVNKKEGYELVSKTGTKFIVIRPRLSDATLSLPRGAAIIYPKDASVILTYGDFFPGARVLECGLGSGALTIPLLRAVGEKGKVVSVERREDFFKNAKKNVEQFFQGSTSGGLELLNAWQPELVEFQEFLEKTVQKFDRVALDLLNPWEFVKQLEKVLVSGAVVSFYVTNTGQLSSLSKALNCSKETDNELTTESKLQGSWKDIEAFEIIRRPWQLDSIALRPEHQGILHSGFVVIAKFVE